MKLIADQMVEIERENLHVDIVGARDYLKEEKNNQRKKAFKETDE